jgi:hypothetical protein
MESQALYALVADALLVAHVLFVVFVVFGLIVVFAGNFLCWRWIRNPWFRVIHLLAISVVVLQSWFGVICPLTIWEMQLRSKSGQTSYDGSFITYWLNELLYYQAPPWVFVVCYTVFAGLVVSSWFLVRPRAFATGSCSVASRQADDR